MRVQKDSCLQWWKILLSNPWITGETGWTRRTAVMDCEACICKCKKLSEINYAFNITPKTLKLTCFAVHALHSTLLATCTFIFNLSPHHFKVLLYIYINTLCLFGMTLNSIFFYKSPSVKCLLGCFRWAQQSRAVATLSINVSLKDWTVFSFMVFIFTRTEGWASYTR